MLSMPLSSMFHFQLRNQQMQLLLQIQPTSHTKL
jgi:hypothetical protein